MTTESTIDSVTVMFAISGFFAIALIVSSIIAIKGNSYGKPKNKSKSKGFIKRH